MIEKLLIKFGILFGIILFPTLFRSPSYKLWIPFFIWNGLVNHLFNLILVKSKKIRYPIRFMPKVFDINFVYDYLVCPYITIWFCQSTYNDKFPNILKKLIFWGMPQVIYEILLEKNTDALEFKNGYKWFHSLSLVFILKLLLRGTLELIKRVGYKVHLL